VYFTPGNIREVAAATLAAGKISSAEARRFLEFLRPVNAVFARARAPQRKDATGE